MTNHPNNFTSPAKLRKDFKASNGKYYTKQLFWEEQSQIPVSERVIECPFTLHKDMDGKINFGRAYVECRDPTGFSCAKLLLPSYNHWTALMSCRWFVAAKEIWDRELDACLKSEGMAEIRRLLEEGLPAQKLAAAKYLANQDYKRNQASKGRPKREDIDRAARDLAANERDVQDDLRRIQAQV